MDDDARAMCAAALAAKQRAFDACAERLRRTEDAGEQAARALEEMHARTGEMRRKLAEAEAALDEERSARMRLEREISMSEGPPSAQRAATPGQGGEARGGGESVQATPGGGASPATPATPLTGTSDALHEERRLRHAAEARALELEQTLARITSSMFAAEEAMDAMTTPPPTRAAQPGASAPATTDEEDPVPDSADSASETGGEVEATNPSPESESEAGRRARFAAALAAASAPKATTLAERPANAFGAARDSAQTRVTKRQHDPHRHSYWGQQAQPLPQHPGQKRALLE